MATVSMHAINPGLYRNMPYDPVRDFAPIAQVGVTPTLLGVHPSLPATDVKSLVALVKDNAGKFSYGSSRPRPVLSLSAPGVKAVPGGRNNLHQPPPARARALSSLFP